MPTAEEVLRDAERTLKASRAVEHPHAGKERIDAEQILEHVLGREPDLDETLDPAAARRFGRLLARRAAGEPPAYITGREEFHGLWLDVGKGAFIPRQSSEWMADQAIRRLRARSRPVYVDLATGVGPVALAVASALPRARVFGTDLFARPVTLARRNAERLRLRNARFVRGDLFAPLPRALQGKVDVITVHPPYIGTRELRTLPHGDPELRATRFAHGQLAAGDGSSRAWWPRHRDALVDRAPDMCRQRDNSGVGSVRVPKKVAVRIYGLAGGMQAIRHFDSLEHSLPVAIDGAPDR